MSDPEPQPEPRGLTVLCPECGQLIEVHDPEALIRTLHLVNECSVRGLLAVRTDD